MDKWMSHDFDLSLKECPQAYISYHAIRELVDYFDQYNHMGKVGVGKTTVAFIHEEKMHIEKSFLKE
jgi:hypothetical protein